MVAEALNELSIIAIAPFEALIPEITKSPGWIEIIFVCVEEFWRNSILPLSKPIFEIIFMSPEAI